MLIIVEGPDGSGKSTLVEKIAEQLQRDEPSSKIEALHKSPPRFHPLDEYERPLLTYRPGRDHHIICDRWHVGEWVYPEVLGRKTDATRAIWYHIEMFLASRGALIVYPYVTEEQLVKRFTKRGDDLVRVHQLAKLIGNYAYMRDLHLAPFRTDDMSPEAIITLARHRERMTQRLNEYTTYVGPPRPEWLLIGDRRNAIHGSADLRPAFMPYRGTSGAYLLAALRRDQFSGLGIMNACEVDDALGAQYLAFDDATTVTLGVNAYAKMNGAGAHHNGVPHPQYIRRFHNKYGHEYAEIIRRARQGEDMIQWRPSSM